LAWAVNPFHSTPTFLEGMYKAKERGQKIVAIDPRITPTTQKLADIHLRIRPGTDGALALGMGKLIIDRGWIDQDYVLNHVYGFERYAEYVKGFDLKKVCGITGLAAGDIERATEWYATNKPSCISLSSASLVHHTNGYQTFRGIMALSALTGNSDVAGGDFPIGETFSHQWAGFETREHEFMHATKPKNARKSISADRFPLWTDFISETQICELQKQIRDKTPYPLHAFVGFGMNHRMLPEPGRFLEAVGTLDFVVNTELFMTEFCRHSDIVLPVCTSFEREEFKVYPGGFASYIYPVIDPLYESRPDSTVIKELADALDLDDPLLRSGYENCVRWMLSGCELKLDDCMKNDGLPVCAPDAKPYVPGEYTKKGYGTPTGKFELWSTSIEKYEHLGLRPLPEYVPPSDGAGLEQYPFVISIGARLPFALHSRMHEVPWVRSLRPKPMADMNSSDAERLGICHGDDITIFNETGSITVRANPTRKILPGYIQMFHGYKEADANELVPAAHLDPYSGFPAYNYVRCQVVKGRKRDARLYKDERMAP
jgi:anaerobic selenocysteine-containing dehydrogenase